MQRLPRMTSRRDAAPAPTRVYTALALVNLLIVGLYRVFLDVPFRPLERVLAAAAVLSLTALLAQRWHQGRPARLLGDLQLGLFAMLVLLLALEGAWRLAPSAFPTWVRDRVQEHDVDAIRKEVVEYLDASPFVKFKPDTVVRSQGFRGTDEEFAYEWRTDRRGFKNPPKIAALDHVDAVALGDSFTEGMGVATEQTWPARLSQAGLPTYNLGVQGYAPSQLAGTFRQYGIPLAPKVVIVGYCASTFAREEAFQNVEAARTGRRFAGGIQLFVDREIRQQRHFLTTALFEAGYAAFASGVTAFKDLFREPRYPQRPAIPIVDAAFQRYAADVAAAPGSPFLIRQIREGGPFWRDSLRAFLDIRDRSRAISARTVLVYLPGRGTMYYERATGRPLLRENFERIEADAIQEFCAANGITFLDPSARIRRHVASIPVGAPQAEYPYLKFDGHMSAKGHALVSEEVLAALAAEPPIPNR